MFRLYRRKLQLTTGKPGEARAHRDDWWFLLAIAANINRIRPYSMRNTARSVKRMKTIKTSINLKESVFAAVEERGDRGEANRSGVISRDMERYYDSLRRARADLRDTILSKAEISAIVDNFKDESLLEMFSIRLIYGSLPDMIELNGIEQKWGIDGKALVDKLRKLSFIESCALVDAIERHWYRVAQGQKPKISEALEG